MNKTIIFAILATAILITGAALPTNVNKKSTSNVTQKYLKKTAIPHAANSHTHFVLASDWPGSLIKKKEEEFQSSNFEKFQSKNFNLHGLWPSGLPNNDCEFPSYCGNTKIDFNQMTKSLKDLLDLNWISMSRNPQQFINYEWKKHGTCQNLNQYDYLTKAINLHEKYNAISALAAYKIYPRDDPPYSLSEIEAAFSQSFGNQVVLDCASIKGEQYLSGIKIFLDKELSRVINPPCKQRSICNQKKPVYLPTFQKN